MEVAVDTDDRELVQEMFLAIKDLPDIRQLAICKGLYGLCVEHFKQANGVLPTAVEEFLDSKGWELTLSSRQEMSEMVKRPGWLTFNDIEWRGELKSEVKVLLAFMVLKGGSPFLHKATTKVSRALLMPPSLISTMMGQLEARGFIKKMNHHDYGVQYTGVVSDGT